MEKEREQRDYSELSMQELVDELLELRHKLEIIKMLNELRLLAEVACTDVYAVTDDLTEHINVLTEMKAVCEELRRRINGDFGI